jgi:hypothetical protein
MQLAAESQGTSGYRCDMYVSGHTQRGHCRAAPPSLPVVGCQPAAARPANHTSDTQRSTQLLNRPAQPVDNHMQLWDPLRVTRSSHTTSPYKPRRPAGCRETAQQHCCLNHTPAPHTTHMLIEFVTHPPCTTGQHHRLLVNSATQNLALTPPPAVPHQHHMPRDQPQTPQEPASVSINRRLLPGKLPH